MGEVKHGPGKLVFITSPSAGPWQVRGPWPAEEESCDDRWIIYGPENQDIIAQVNGLLGEDAANAHLIAAAPDLLEACELIVRAERQAVAALNDAGLACPADLGLAAEKARAALTKAESASP